MKAKLIYLWDKLRTNFWFIPLLIIILAVLAAYGLVFIDNTVNYKPEGLIRLFFSGTADSARSVLSVIAGAMIGVAGTVFSITLVALTLASSQFGPRLLRNFMHDRLNQVVLGSYVASFIYCLLVLRIVQAENKVDFVPNISVLFAILGAFVNILLLIWFIHHISVNIQADKVIADLDQGMLGNIKNLFPDQKEATPSPPNQKDIDHLKKEYSASFTVYSNKNAYLQAVDYEGLLSLALENDLVIHLDHRAGNFLVQGAELVRIWCRKECDDPTKKKILDSFVIGQIRTPAQDAEFAIHQMVEIAARALSPGINDPYTAISCIDRLTSTMCYLTHAKFPVAHRLDEEGKLRLVLNPLTFGGLLDAAFHQIRQFGKDSPAVLIHLMEALITIFRFTQNQSQKNAVKRHADMVLRAGETAFIEKNDVADLKDRYKAFD